MHKFNRNLFNCECGGLRHICTKWGHLPESINHYQDKREQASYDVVWNGTLEREGQAAITLLPDREEHPDARLDTIPNYDIDEGEGAIEKPSRAYNRTGKFAGKFSRTNPAIPHYRPTAQSGQEKSNG